MNVPGFPGITMGMAKEARRNRVSDTPRSSIVNLTPDIPSKSLSNFGNDIESIKNIWKDETGKVDLFSVQKSLESFAVDLMRHNRQLAIDNHSKAHQLQEIGRMAAKGPFQTLMNDWSKKLQVLLEKAMATDSKDNTFGHLSHMGSCFSGHPSELSF